MQIKTYDKEMEEHEQWQRLKSMIREFAYNFFYFFIKTFFEVGIFAGAVFTLFILIRLVFGWDFLYETDVDYVALFCLFFGVFLGLGILFIFSAVFFYNLKHKRNTDYAYKHVDEVDQNNKTGKKTKKVRDKA